MENIERPLPTAMEQRPETKTANSKVPFSKPDVKGNRILESNVSMNEFIEKMKTAGLKPPSSIVPEKWVRFPGIGKKESNQAGYCFLFPDCNGGLFGDFSSDLNTIWNSQEVRNYSNEQLIAHKDMGKKAKQDYKKLQEIEWKNAAEKAQETFNTLPEAKDHKYLKKKQIKSYGLRIKDNLLIIPLYTGL